MTNDLLELVLHSFFVILLWVVAFVAIVSAIISTVRLVKVRKQRKQLEEELRKTDAMRLRREKMTTQEKIEVMQAYAEGKKIQVKERNSNNWRDYGDILAPEWNWGDYDYRIKPEEKYRPYKDTEEMIADFKKRFNAKVPPYAMPMIWLKYKDIKDCRLITGFMSKTVVLIGSAVGMCNLFDQYTYLDGSSCGMKEE